MMIRRVDESGKDDEAKGKAKYGEFLRLVQSGQLSRSSV